jgi:hypothetical protein
MQGRFKMTGTAPPVLAKEAAAPVRPMRASREEEEMSTPQMIRVKVTALYVRLSVMRLFGRA